MLICVKQTLLYQGELMLRLLICAPNILPPCMVKTLQLTDTYLLCITCIQRIQSKGIRGLPTQTTSCPWGAEVYTEEAVLTCSMASGQRLPPPIIWHLVLLDGVLCGNSMFQQRLLICVMSVVCKEKTLFSLWSPFNTLYGVSASGWGMLRDVETLEVLLGWLGWNMVQICKMVKLS